MFSEYKEYCKEKGLDACRIESLQAFLNRIKE